MTPADLAAAGRLLYGDAWQMPLARALGVDRRTVGRWAAGSAPIPGGVADEIAALRGPRAHELRAEARELEARAARLMAA